ncbi:MAG: hypothetical protein AAF830_11820 [Pseudomonadota bacterium]
MDHDSILICEDDPVQAKILTAGAARRNLTIYGPCETEEDALAAAQVAPICGALLDVSLIGGTVHEIARILKDRDLPFAFITAYGPGTDQVLRAFPENLVIPKPITLDTLDLILDRLLEGSPLKKAVG